MSHASYPSSQQHSSHASAWPFWFSGRTKPSATEAQRFSCPGACWFVRGGLTLLKESMITDEVLQVVHDFQQASTGARGQVPLPDSVASWMAHDMSLSSSTDFIAALAHLGLVSADVTWLSRLVQSHSGEALVVQQRKSVGAILKRYVWRTALVAMLRSVKEPSQATQKVVKRHTTLPSFVLGLACSVVSSLRCRTRTDKVQTVSSPRAPSQQRA